MNLKEIMFNEEKINNIEKDIKKLKEKKNDRDSIEMFLNMFSYLSILAFTGFIIKSFFPEYSDVYSLLFFIGMFPGIFVWIIITEIMIYLYKSKYKSKDKYHRLSYKYFRSCHKNEVNFIKENYKILNNKKLSYSYNSFYEKLILSKIENMNNNELIENENIIKNIIKNTKKEKIKEKIIKVIDNKLNKTEIKQEEKINKIFNSKKVLKSI